MKRFCLIGLFFVLALSPVVQAVKTANALVPQGSQRVTLYSLNKYPSDYGRALFSFKLGAFVRDLDLWDLTYGSLYVGDEWDWFSVSTAANARTVARDLGELNWGEGFNVPVIEPFPKLKEGQMRSFKVDASGADGADGVGGDGKLRPTPGSPQKRSGAPVVDPVFVKAILGHMYVVRVVDNDSDFYVLFRVEALERGDYCTISWQRIPSPEEKVNDK
jgi:hypothetical protein